MCGGSADARVRWLRSAFRRVGVSLLCLLTGCCLSSVAARHPVKLDDGAEYHFTLRAPRGPGLGLLLVLERDVEVERGQYDPIQEALQIQWTVHVNGKRVAETGSVGRTFRPFQGKGRIEQRRYHVLDRFPVECGDVCDVRMKVLKSTPLLRNFECSLEVRPGRIPGEHEPPMPDDAIGWDHPEGDELGDRTRALLDARQAHIKAGGK
jgi:hypothetical protein